MIREQMRLRNLLFYGLPLFLLLAEAHGFPRTEIFGGYSYFYVTPAFQVERLQVPGSNLHGWIVSGSTFFARRVGIEFDLMHHAGAVPTVDLRSPLPAPIGKTGFDHIVFLAGPRFEVLQTRHMSASLSALFGSWRGNLERQPLLDGGLSETNFAAAFGGSVDFKLNERWAISVIRPNLFILRRPFLGTYKTFQFSTGLVFRLGRN